MQTMNVMSPFMIWALLLDLPIFQLSHDKRRMMYGFWLCLCLYVSLMFTAVIGQHMEYSVRFDGECIIHFLNFTFGFAILIINYAWKAKAYHIWAHIHSSDWLRSGLIHECSSCNCNRPPSDRYHILGNLFTYVPFPQKKKIRNTHTNRTNHRADRLKMQKHCARLIQLAAFVRHTEIFIYFPRSKYFRWLCRVRVFVFVSHVINYILFLSFALATQPSSSVT